MCEDNEHITQAVELALNQSNHLPTNIRDFLVIKNINIIQFQQTEEICNDSILKKHLYEQEPIRLIMNKAIECDNSSLTAYDILTAKIYIKLMQFKRDKAYIPGETLQVELLRIKMMLMGSIAILIHLYKHSLCKEISDLAIEHVCTCYAEPELEWFIKVLKESVHGKMQYIYINMNF